MKAYVCVYLHPVPHRREFLLTQQAAADHPMLQRYLDGYEREDCFYDWGDDPSFFCASEVLGSSNGATWGVCRRDVRAAVSRGDVIAFFCGREQPPGYWQYFYVGVGTVGSLLDRERIWAQEE